FHLAVHTGEQTSVYSLTLTKGARTREEEEAVLDAVLLNALAEAFGVPERMDPPLLEGEEVQLERSPAADALAEFLRGGRPALCVEAAGRLRAAAPLPALVIPGAFNPMHEGHWGLAETAARLRGAAVAFELSVINVDKPPLAAGEVRRRLEQFAWRAPVWVTRAPTFAEKGALFP